MPPLDALLAFAAVSVALIAVPGPSVLFVVSRGVALGRRAALLTVVGNAVGVYVQVLLVAVGLGVVLERSATAFNLVRLAGAVYLVVLGLRAIRRRGSLPAVIGDAGAPSSRSLIVEGALVGLTNPKLLVFLAAILPQFVQPGGAPARLQIAVLGLVFVGVALVLDSLWGLAAGSARTWLGRSSARLERLGILGGVVMVGLGLRVAFERSGRLRTRTRTGQPA